MRVARWRCVRRAYTHACGGCAYEHALSAGRGSVTPHPPSWMSIQSRPPGISWQTRQSAQQGDQLPDIHRRKRETLNCQLLLWLLLCVCGAVVRLLVKHAASVVNVAPLLSWCACQYLRTDDNAYIYGNHCIKEKKYWTSIHYTCSGYVVQLFTIQTVKMLNWGSP